MSDARLSDEQLVEAIRQLLEVGEGLVLFSQKSKKKNRGKQKGWYVTVKLTYDRNAKRKFFVNDWGGVTGLD